MSIKHRVRKLEEKTNSDFRVAYPVSLDAKKERFLQRPAPDAVAFMEYRCAGEKVTVRRAQNETLADLRERLVDAVRQRIANDIGSRFKGAVFLAVKPT